jgi:hypothetical protein
MIGENDREVTINAEALTQVAKHLRVTLAEFTKAVEKFDNTVAALIQANDAYVTRLEKLYERTPSIL